ncbi:MAG: acyl-ACP desaturase, partial [Firmicutes bacterium]|nr:acyl-ACP desaturase [Bacillota bacterium]
GCFLLSALTETLDTLLQRHQTLTHKRDWSYFALLPWERGRNFLKEPWTPNQGTLSPELTIAVDTAMLTEVNLPWFTSGLNSAFAESPSALKEFVHTWTAEEDQHGRVLETYLYLSRNGDPHERDQLRKQVLTTGWEVPVSDPLALMAYTSLQELATRVFYSRLARNVAGQDADLNKILQTIAKDETLHYTFYRDAVKAYLEENPNQLVTICQIIPRFTMPGFGMPNFSKRLRIISKFANYGVSAYFSQVLQVVLSAWGVFEYQTSSITQPAIHELKKYIARLQRIAVATA